MIILLCLYQMHIQFSKQKLFHFVMFTVLKRDEITFLFNFIPFAWLYNFFFLETAVLNVIAH